MLTGILDNRDDLRVAVVVNDVASVNVDGAVIRKELVGVDETEVELLELQNGCVCCGASALELAGNVKDLVQVGADRGKPFDHVVIEMSGVADPRAVQYNLEDGGVAVDRVVTVVDAPAFAEQWMSWDTMEDRVADDGPPPDPYHGVVDARKAALASVADLEADPCAAQRKVTALLVAQVEAADAVAINKVDMASAKDVETASLTCAALVPDADVLVTEFGRAALYDLLPNVAKPAPAAEEASSCCSNPDCASKAEAAHDHDHDHDHAAPTPLTVDALGVSSFAYENHERPFDYAKLLGLIKRWPIPQKDVLNLDDVKPGGAGVPGVESAWEAVLRSKGFAWLASHPNRAISWAFAGKHFALEDAGDWDGVTPRSEIVVIGVDIDEAKLRADLDGCLVDDAQLEAYLERDRAAGPRFDVGAAVECNLGGPNGWTPGTVVTHNYIEEGWDAPVPYQVELGDGTLIFAPADSDEVIRASLLNIESKK